MSSPWRYACLDLTEMQGLREIEAELYSYFNGQLHGNRIWTGWVSAVSLIQEDYAVIFMINLHFSRLLPRKFFFNKQLRYCLCIAFALPLLFKLFTSILLLMLFVQHRPWHWSHSHSTFVLFILFRSWKGIWLLRWLWTVGKNYSCYCLFYKLLI